MFIPSLSLLVTFALRIFHCAETGVNGSHETKRNSAVKLLNEGEFKEKGL